MDADPRGDARERSQWQQPRREPERDRDPSCCRERRGDADRELRRRVRRKRYAQHARADRGKDEAGESGASRTRHEEHGEPEARRRPTHLRKGRHLTSTAARSTWPFAVTVSV